MVSLESQQKAITCLDGMIRRARGSAYGIENVRDFLQAFGKERTLPSYAKIAEEVRLDNMMRYTARMMWILSAEQAEKYSLQAARKAATIAYYHLRSRTATCCSAVGASAGMACEGEAKL